ncbi:MAG TPA: alpha/beta hydrolase fold domain-containing protein, partial [Burkholderiaceae bacterium]|nr:alpha/beta hydrolase fold domain-containing protein [Burkholderiaceae bacterium]
TFQKLAALRLMYAEPARFLDPTVSPLYGDFTGFPPLLFHAGEIEMLRDESVRVAERAYAAGVTVEVEVWRDMAHVFHALPLPQARPADDSIVQFVERHAGWRPESISPATVATAELHGVQS